LSQDTELINRSLRTPRAAAVAGILFSVLLITSQLLIWLSIPADPLGPASALLAHTRSINLALGLLPFSGIAFLWFIAVVRDRLGALEDRFFATVLLGSGLLYVAMVFSATAIAGALLTLLAIRPADMLPAGIYVLGRAEIYRFHSLFATKMAAVFMGCGSTIFLRTRVVPRWVAFTGYLLAAVLLVSLGEVPLINMVFPVWVFLVSVCVLIESKGSAATAAAR